MSKRVALVGTCPSSQMLAPFGDFGIDIWACSPDNAMGVLPRITRFFEIHGDLGHANGPWGPYIQWLNQQAEAGAFELIVQDRHLFPRGKVMPHEELIARFGRLFFTSTPAWMMATAIAEGYKEVWLYGLDMSSRHEYVLQRPGMHHFIELAEQKFGVTVFAPLESDILQPAPLYGFDRSTPRGRKVEVRRQELESRIADLDRQSQQIAHDRAYLQGALDDIDYWQQIWGGERDASLPQPERTPMPQGKVVPIKGD